MSHDWQKIKEYVKENPNISLDELLEKLEVVIDDQIERRMITHVEWLHED